MLRVWQIFRNIRNIGILCSSRSKRNIPLFASETTIEMLKFSTEHFVNNMYPIRKYSSPYKDHYISEN